jgi:hypothetical protein
MTKSPTTKKRPRKPTHYAASKSTVAPVVVSVVEAMRMGCWGKTKLFDLIRDGELESFLDGPVRRITVASILARIQRKLQETKNDTAQSGEPAAP